MLEFRLMKSPTKVYTKFLSVVSALLLFCVSAEAHCVHKKLQADEAARLRREIATGRGLVATMTARLAALEAQLAEPCPFCKGRVQPSPRPYPISAPYRPSGVRTWDNPMVKSALYKPYPESQLIDAIKRVYGIPAHVQNSPVLLNLLVRKYHEQPISAEDLTALSKEATRFNEYFNHLTQQAKNGDRNAVKMRRSLYALFYLYEDSVNEKNLRRGRLEFDF